MPQEFFTCLESRSLDMNLQSTKACAGRRIVTMSSVINVWIGSAPEPIEVDCRFQDIRNMEELKNYLAKKSLLTVPFQDRYGNPQKCDIREDFNFVDSLAREFGPTVKLDDAFISGLPEHNNRPAGVICHIKPVSIQVRHLGLSIPLTNVPKHATIEYIKAELASAAPEVLRDSPLSDVDISFKGDRLRDSEQLHDVMKSLGENVETYENEILSGLMRVRVVDQECQVDGYALVTEYDSVETLLMRYAEQQRRTIYRGSIIKTETEECHDLSASMFSLQIDHEDQIVLVNPWYQVAVREADALLVGNIDERTFGLPINARDDMTGAELKRLYGEVSRRPLTVNDKLFFDREPATASTLIDEKNLEALKSIPRLRGSEALEITDDRMLFTYNVKHGARLRVVREPPEQQFEYQCAKCGKDVMLKRSDQVQCRQCGYRVLFKKRTTKVAHIFKCE